MRNSFILSFIILFPLYFYAQETPTKTVTKNQNAVDQQVILDLAKEDIYKEFNQNVLVDVTLFKVSKNYAWFEGNASRTDGNPLEFPDEGYDCCHVEGLFEKQNGYWVAVEFSSFSTDVWYSGIATRYPKAPKSIFPQEAKAKN